MTAMLPAPGGVAIAQIVSGLWTWDDLRYAVRGVRRTVCDVRLARRGPVFLYQRDDDDSR
jgi:hypothetical protein